MTQQRFYLLGAWYETAKQLKDYATMIRIDRIVERHDSACDFAWWILFTEGRNFVLSALNIELLNI